ncbi:MAG TPA: saccharopine dehydrogenase NADP-binding domain-containing protein [Steroidobacteraceae bacterium]|nr:saccharopine dehydrogenase NADP-binding domain-containing protein [Steroidobacteraceae bacterium]
MRSEAKSWLLYGANGYTGELIAREAAARGQRPILAGRNAAAIEKLARELGCEGRPFALDDEAALSKGLSGVAVVLHCAGPFSTTAYPMMRACLRARAHYLDITGEIDVFERAHSLDREAREAGILLCPGAGFDVVPSDCLAAQIKAALPDATHLALAFDSRSAPSRGTAKTMIEGLRERSKVRVDGRIVSIPLASCVRQIDFGEGPKNAIAIPWGDVSTAFYTTGIANIEVYIPSSPRAVRRLRRLDRWRLVLGLGAVQSWLKRRVERSARGPDTEQRERTPVLLWGEGRNAAGRTIVGRMRVANGYTTTVHSSLVLVERMLDATTPTGYRTPSQVVGADFVSRLPGATGVSIRDR